MMLAAWKWPCKELDVSAGLSHFYYPLRRIKCGFLSHRNLNGKRRVFATQNCSRGEAYGNPNADRPSPYQVLGIDPSSPCSLHDIKAAFRAKVKEYHPDVNKDARDSNVMIRCVIQAYEILSKQHQLDNEEREYRDPFDYPECEALDLFVNEVFCVGQGCPYSCVKRAPHAFSFNSIYGTARAISQGHGEDYQVQVATAQCPRSCIHYVTPLQRVILEELLDSVLKSPYRSAEAALLDSLLVKARFENNRYQKPKKSPEASTEYVDWL